MGNYYGLCPGLADNEVFFTARGVSWLHFAILKACWHIVFNLLKLLVQAFAFTRLNYCVSLLRRIVWYMLQQRIANWATCLSLKLDTHTCANFFTEARQANSWWKYFQKFYPQVLHLSSSTACYVPPLSIRYHYFVLGWIIYLCKHDNKKFVSLSQSFITNFYSNYLVCLANFWFVKYPELLTGSETERFKHLVQFSETRYLIFLKKREDFACSEKKIETHQ